MMMSKEKSGWEVEKRLIPVISMRGNGRDITLNRGWTKKEREREREMKRRREKENNESNLFRPPIYPKKKAGQNLSP